MIISGKRQQNPYIIKNTNGDMSNEQKNTIEKTIRELSRIPSIVRIDIWNQSKAVDDNTVRQYTSDLQIQLDRDYAKFWDTTSKL